MAIRRENLKEHLAHYQSLSSSDIKNSQNALAEKLASLTPSAFSDFYANINPSFTKDEIKSTQKELVALIRGMSPLCFYTFNHALEKNEYAEVLRIANMTNEAIEAEWVSGLTSILKETAAQLAGQRTRNELSITAKIVYRRTKPARPVMYDVPTFRQLKDDSAVRQRFEADIAQALAATKKDLMLVSITATKSGLAETRFSGAGHAEPETFEYLRYSLRHYVPRALGGNRLYSYRDPQFLSDLIGYAASNAYPIIVINAGYNNVYQRAAINAPGHVPIGPHRAQSNTPYLAVWPDLVKDYYTLLLGSQTFTSFAPLVYDSHSPNGLTASGLKEDKYQLPPPGVEVTPGRPNHIGGRNPRLLAVLPLEPGRPEGADDMVRVVASQMDYDRGNLIGLDGLDLMHLGEGLAGLNNIAQARTIAANFDGGNARQMFWVDENGIHPVGEISVNQQVSSYIGFFPIDDGEEAPAAYELVNTATFPTQPQEIQIVQPHPDTPSDKAIVDQALAGTLPVPLGMEKIALFVFAQISAGKTTRIQQVKAEFPEIYGIVSLDQDLLREMAPWYGELMRKGQHEDAVKDTREISSRWTGLILSEATKGSEARHIVTPVTLANNLAPTIRNIRNLRATKGYVIHIEVIAVHRSLSEADTLHRCETEKQRFGGGGRNVDPETQGISYNADLLKPFDQHKLADRMAIITPEGKVLFEKHLLQDEWDNSRSLIDALEEHRERAITADEEAAYRERFQRTLMLQHMRNATDDEQDIAEAAIKKALLHIHRSRIRDRRQVQAQQAALNAQVQEDFNQLKAAAPALAQEAKTQARLERKQRIRYAIDSLKENTEIDHHRYAEQLHLIIDHPDFTTSERIAEWAAFCRESAPLHSEESIQAVNFRMAKDLRDIATEDLQSATSKQLYFLATSLIQTPASADCRECLYNIANCLLTQPIDRFPDFQTTEFDDLIKAFDKLSEDSLYGQICSNARDHIWSLRARNPIAPDVSKQDVNAAYGKRHELFTTGTSEFLNFIHANVWDLSIKEFLGCVSLLRRAYSQLTSNSSNIKIEEKKRQHFIKLTVDKSSEAALCYVEKMHKETLNADPARRIGIWNAFLKEFEGLPSQNEISKPIVRKMAQSVLEMTENGAASSLLLELLPLSHSLIEQVNDKDCRDALSSITEAVSSLEEDERRIAEESFQKVYEALEQYHETQKGSDFRLDERSEVTQQQSITPLEESVENEEIFSSDAPSISEPKSPRPYEPKMPVSSAIAATADVPDEAAKRSIAEWAASIRSMTSEHGDELSEEQLIGFIAEFEESNVDLKEGAHIKDVLYIANIFQRFLENEGCQDTLKELASVIVSTSIEVGGQSELVIIGQLSDIFRGQRNQADVHKSSYKKAQRKLKDVENNMTQAFDPLNQLLAAIKSKETEKARRILIGILRDISEYTTEVLAYTLAPHIETQAFFQELFNSHEILVEQKSKDWVEWLSKMQTASPSKFSKEKHDLLFEAIKKAIGTENKVVLPPGMITSKDWARCLATAFNTFLKDVPFPDSLAQANDQAMIVVTEKIKTFNLNCLNFFKALVNGQSILASLINNRIEVENRIAEDPYKDWRDHVHKFCRALLEAKMYQGEMKESAKAESVSLREEIALDDENLYEAIKLDPVWKILVRDPTDEFGVFQNGSIDIAARKLFDEWKHAVKSISESTDSQQEATAATKNTSSAFDIVALEKALVEFQKAPPDKKSSVATKINQLTNGASNLEVANALAIGPGLFSASFNDDSTFANLHAEWISIFNLPRRFSPSQANTYIKNLTSFCRGPDNNIRDIDNEAWIKKYVPSAQDASKEEKQLLTLIRDYYVLFPEEEMPRKFMQAYLRVKTNLGKLIGRYKTHIVSIMIEDKILKDILPTSDRTKKNIPSKSTSPSVGAISNNESAINLGRNYESLSAHLQQSPMIQLVPLEISNNFLEEGMQISSFESTSVRIGTFASALWGKMSDMVRPITSYFWPQTTASDQNQQPNMEFFLDNADILFFVIHRKEYSGVLVYDKRDGLSPDFHYYNTRCSADFDDAAIQLAKYIHAMDVPALCDFSGPSFFVHATPTQHRPGDGEVLTCEIIREIGERYLADKDCSIGELDTSRMRTLSILRPAFGNGSIVGEHGQQVRSKEVMNDENWLAQFGKCVFDVDRLGDIGEMVDLASSKPTDNNLLALEMVSSKAWRKFLQNNQYAQKHLAEIERRVSNITKQTKPNVDRHYVSFIREYAEASERGNVDHALNSIFSKLGNKPGKDDRDCIREILSFLKEHPEENIPQEVQSFKSMQQYLSSRLKIVKERILNLEYLDRFDEHFQGLVKDREQRLKDLGSAVSSSLRKKSQPILAAMNKGLSLAAEVEDTGEKVKLFNASFDASMVGLSEADRKYATFLKDCLFNPDDTQRFEGDLESLRKEAASLLRMQIKEINKVIKEKQAEREVERYYDGQYREGTPFPRLNREQMAFLEENKFERIPLPSTGKVSVTPQKIFKDDNNEIQGIVLEIKKESLKAGELRKVYFIDSECFSTSSPLTGLKEKKTTLIDFSSVKKLPQSLTKPAQLRRQQAFR